MTIWNINIFPLTILYKTLLNIIGGKVAISRDVYILTCYPFSLLIIKYQLLVLFLEVDLQRSTYIVFAFVVLHSRGGGPGSWLMHFPYVVLHGCFGFF